MAKIPYSNLVQKVLEQVEPWRYETCDGLFINTVSVNISIESIEIVGPRAYRSGNGSRKVALS